MQKRLLLILAFILIGGNFTGVHASFEPDEQVNITVYEKISPAIVAIDVQLKDGVSAGTGCIVSQDGLILYRLRLSCRRRSVG